MSPSTSRSRIPVVLLIIPLLMLALSACGGGDDTAGPTEPAAVDPPAAPADDPPPADQVADAEATVIGAEVFYAGFRVEVEQIRTIPEEETAEVDLVVENQRSRDAVFPTEELELRWDGDSVVAAFVGEEVRAGASATVTATFRQIDPSFTVDGAVLVAGTPQQIEVVVPLDVPAAAVPAAPIALATPDPVSGERLDGVITDMTLYAYDPLGFRPEQQPVDEPMLVITIDLTMAEDPDRTTQYQANVLSDSFRLVHADGTQVAPASGPNEVLNSGTTTHDLDVSFPLRGVPFTEDQLPTDDWTLLVSPVGVALDEEISFTFVLTPVS